MELEELVRRARMWYIGQLPTEDEPPSYDMLVFGPPTHGGVDRSTLFHTYVCLYPYLGIYVVGEFDGELSLPVRADRVRQIIAEYVPSHDDVIRQQQLTKDEYALLDTAALRWEYACVVAKALNLPAAMLIFGHTQVTRELVVYQRSMLATPLLKVSKELKLAAAIDVSH